MFLVFNNFLFGQTKQLFPKGGYETISDFSSVKTREIGLFSIKFFGVDYRFHIKNDKSRNIKHLFAVSDGENLYVKAKEISKNLVNKEWIILNDERGVYYKAHFINDSLLYFENDELTKSYAIIGIGVSRLRGIVYQKSISKFRVLKKNQDIKEFLNQERPKLLQKYNFSENKIVDINLVRKIMDDIFFNR